MSTTSQVQLEFFGAPPAGLESEPAFPYRAPNLKTSQGETTQVIDALKEGNAALKDANTALRELVASLQHERKLLIDKINDLEAKIGLQICTGNHEIESHLRQEQQPLPLDVANLPHEILLRICLAAIPGRHQYDSSILAGPRSPWVQSMITRKSLTLVCRTWNGPASEALYTDIVFRRMGQISALARTFRASAVVNAPHRVRFVKRIYMDCCAIFLSCEDVVREDLAYLLQQCTELQLFTFRPHPEFEYYAECHPSSMVNPRWLFGTDEEPCVQALGQRCHSGLQELIFMTEFDPTDFLNVLGTVRLGVHLKSLTLGAMSSRHSLTNELPVDLPSLEVLQIHLRNGPDGLPIYISELWALPLLERLTLVGCNYFPETLLTTHGLRLKYVHIIPGNSHSWHDSEPSATTFSLVGKWCPVLEHLAMPHFLEHDPLCNLRSPTLRYLDLWGSPGYKRRVIELWAEMGRASWLPELAGVRLLPVGQATQLPVDLPHICHPEDVRADEVLVRTFPHTRVLQTSWTLFTDRAHNMEAPSINDELPSDAESSWHGSQCGGDAAVEGEGGEESEGGDVEECNDGTSWVSESDASDATSELTQNSAPVEAYGDSAADVEEVESLEYFDRDSVLERFTASQEVYFLFDGDSTDDTD